jgi:hypothetical protein
MKKYIIREIPPESYDNSYYFDDDGLTEAGGDYCYNLFIISDSRRLYGFNMEEYKHVREQAEAIIDGFNDVSEKYNSYYNSYKECMEYNDIVYNSRKCHLLKEWAKNADTEEAEDMAEFLTIRTGKRWETDNAHGYSQGDYVEMVYCPEHYKNGVKSYGEIWLGAYKEFCVVDLDDSGNEADACYGFCIADCQVKTDEDYKKLVCEWEGIKEEETSLEMIDEQKHYTKYIYKEVA